jgi:hypothetical protein
MDPLLPERALVHLRMNQVLNIPDATPFEEHPDLSPTEESVLHFYWKNNVAGDYPHWKQPEDLIAEYLAAKQQETAATT